MILHHPNGDSTSIFFQKRPPDPPTQNKKGGEGGQEQLSVQTVRSFRSRFCKFETCALASNFFWQSICYLLCLQELPLIRCRSRRLQSDCVDFLGTRSRQCRHRIKMVVRKDTSNAVVRNQNIFADGRGPRHGANLPTIISQKIVSTSVVSFTVLG